MVHVVLSHWSVKWTAVSDDLCSIYFYSTYSTIWIKWLLKKNITKFIHILEKIGLAWQFGWRPTITYLNPWHAEDCYILVFLSVTWVRAYEKQKTADKAQWLKIIQNLITEVNNVMLLCYEVRYKNTMSNEFIFTNYVYFNRFCFRIILRLLSVWKLAFPYKSCYWFNRNATYELTYYNRVFSQIDKGRLIHVLLMATD